MRFTARIRSVLDPTCDYDVTCAACPRAWSSFSSPQARTAVLQGCTTVVTGRGLALSALTAGGVTVSLRYRISPAYAALVTPSIVS